MKKSIVLALTAISLMACRNDDSNNSEATLVGTWKPVKYLVIDGKTQKELTSENVDDCEGKDRIVFNNNGTASNESYENVSGVCKNWGVENGTYKYDNSSKKLSISFPNDNATIDVRTLNATTLELVGDADDENGDGVLDLYTTVYSRVK